MFIKNNFPVSRYSELSPERILSTLDKLQQRIAGRFPDSGLSKVAEELILVADAIKGLIDRLRRPIWAIRLLTIIAILGLISFAVWLGVTALSIAPAGQDGLMEVLQAIESVTNELIFLSLAIYFFITLENRLKRQAALESLHRLRSVAHVVDMHQLTKDPADLFGNDTPDGDAHEGVLTAYALTRYLDYCTELLAINSKLAALHVQYFQDKEVLKIVNEVEMLAHELSNKIWQKIMILDVTTPEIKQRKIDPPAAK